MNRAEMITEVRRRANDPATSVLKQYSDAEIRTALGAALLDVQTEVMAINPGAFISIDTFDIVAGQSRYDKPPGFLSEYKLAIADSRYSSGWRPLIRSTMSQLDQRVSTANLVGYQSLGRWFTLSPTPANNLNQGMLLVWSYSLTMDDDAAVPLVPLPLHDAIVDLALVRLFIPTSEKDTRDEAMARASLRLSQLPRWYRRSRATHSPTIQPKVRGNYQRRLPRDWYPGGI
jgi:hypothetical protein